MCRLFLAIIFPVIFIIVGLFFLTVFLLGAFFESGRETLSWLVFEIAVSISSNNLVVYMNPRVDLAFFWLILVEFHFLVDSLQNITVQDHNPIKTTVGVKATCTFRPLEVIRKTIFYTMVLVK